MTNEDAIVILKELKGILIYDPSWEDKTKQVVDKAFEMAIEALKKQKPQGHWIDTGATGPDKFKVYQCSKCGTKVFMGYPEYSNMREYRGFCSHCGADMSGGDDDVDGKHYHR